MPSVTSVVQSVSPVLFCFAACQSPRPSSVSIRAIRGWLESVTASLREAPHSRQSGQSPSAAAQTPTLSDEQLDAFNTEILIRVQESGIAVPSNARFDGRLAIRVANVNHRTRREDFDTLVHAVLSTGKRLLSHPHP